jgi:hypothetical protein
MVGTLGDWPVLESALALVKEHGAKLVGLALGFVPVLWGVYQARRQWRTRQFMSRFSVSLNILRRDPAGTVLWIPAAGEYDVEEVFHRNRTALRIVRKAAAATTPAEPFLVTIPEDDRRSLLNEVANRVEVMLRAGSFAALAGLPVRFLPLVIGLSCEKGADVRIRKIRALVVEESLLREIDRLAAVRFDKPHHVVRAQTLRRMAALYAEQPDLFARIVVALPLPEAAAAHESESRTAASGDSATSRAASVEAYGIAAPPTAARPSEDGVEATGQQRAEEGSPGVVTPPPRPTCPTA